MIKDQNEVEMFYLIFYSIKDVVFSIFKIHYSTYDVFHMNL